MRSRDDLPPAVFPFATCLVFFTLPTFVGTAASDGSSVVVSAALALLFFTDATDFGFAGDGDTRTFALTRLLRVRRGENFSVLGAGDGVDDEDDEDFLALAAAFGFFAERDVAEGALRFCCGVFAGMALAPSLPSGGSLE